MCSLEIYTGNSTELCLGIGATIESFIQITDGINAVWMSPVFASPNVDNGYDISDYTAIMEEFGTMEDWDAFRDGAHARGIAIIMDLVLNHSSDKHVWFKESRKSRTNPYSDYYIWRDPAADGSAPNSWKSVFGGSAWEYVPERGQYYLHFFAKEQPDLNWDNPETKEKIFDIIRFWNEKGVDGYRIDAKFLQIIKFFHHSFQISDSVMVAVFKTPWINLIDHQILIPVFFMFHIVLPSSFCIKI